MAISVKAAFNFSATVATTTTWTLTASTSVVIGDTVVVAVTARISATANEGFATGVADNAGNTWAVAGQVAHTADATAARIELWYAPVTATTANYQVALTYPGTTVSARVAQVIVITGLNTTSPLDAGTVKTSQQTITASTITQSTSLVTTIADSIALAVVGGGTLNSSVSADAAWTRIGISLKAQGNANVVQDSFFQIATATQIYSFSASTSPTGRGIGMIMAAFKAVSGSISGQSNITFASNAAITGTAKTLSGQSTVAFNQLANITGTAKTLSGQSTVAFGTQATIAGAAATLSGQTTVAFGLQGAITGTAATLSGAATIDFGGIATLVDLGTTPPVVVTPDQDTGAGGGWKRRRYREMLEILRRQQLARAREALHLTREAVTNPPDSVMGEGVSGPPPKAAAVREASLVAQRLLEFRIASARREWQLREQESQLLAMQHQLNRIEERLLDDEEDDELLLLVA